MLFSKELHSARCLQNAVLYLTFLCKAILHFKQQLILIKQPTSLYITAKDIS